MNCRHVEKWMNDNITSSGIELPDEIRNHVDSCDKCRAYYRELLGLLEKLDGLNSIMLTADESSQLIRKIETAIDHSAQPDSKQSLIRWIATIARPALAVAAVLIITLFSTPHLPTDSTVSQEMEEVLPSRTGQENLLQLLLNGDLDYLSSLLDQSSISYITDQVKPGQVDDILNDISAEEMEWLMENLKVEI
jgi:hypothetical protein